MRTGASHFVSADAALRYYAPYGFTAIDVSRKLAEGEIHIGKPELREGEPLSVIRGEGRYYAGWHAAHDVLGLTFPISARANACAFGCG